MNLWILNSQRALWVTNVIFTSFLKPRPLFSLWSITTEYPINKAPQEWNLITLQFIIYLKDLVYTEIWFKNSPLYKDGSLYIAFLSFYICGCLTFSCQLKGTAVHCRSSPGHGLASPPNWAEYNYLTLLHSGLTLRGVQFPVWQMRLSRPGTQGVQPTVQPALQIVALYVYCMLHRWYKLCLRKFEVKVNPYSIKVLF